MADAVPDNRKGAVTMGGLQRRVVRPAGGPQPAPRTRRELMSIRTCVSLLIIGGVLIFALRRHPSFLDPQVAGVILMATGAVGLWPRGGLSLVRQARVHLRHVLTEIAPVDGARVPLDDLMLTWSSQTSHVWAPHTGHDLRRDGTARSDHRAPGDRVPAGRR